MHLYYILDQENKPVPEDDYRAYGEWMRSNGRRLSVGDDFIDTIRVSTIFLGLTHGELDGKPLLWETMVFLREGVIYPSEIVEWYSNYIQRYTSYDDALVSHIELTANIQNMWNREAAKCVPAPEPKEEAAAPLRTLLRRGKRLVEFD